MQVQLDGAFFMSAHLLQNVTLWNLLASDPVFQWNFEFFQIILNNVSNQSVLSTALKENIF